MNKTIFEITKMDCPSEENLIRMKLDGISSIANLDFDIPNRKLIVFHSGQIDQIEKSVIELNLGGKKISTEQTDQTEFNENANQKKTTLDCTRNQFRLFPNRNDNWNNLKVNGISC
jgi:cation transport ATPase